MGAAWPGRSQWATGAEPAQWISLWAMATKLFRTLIVLTLAVSLSGVAATRCLFALDNSEQSAALSGAAATPAPCDGCDKYNPNSDTCMSFCAYSFALPMVSGASETMAPALQIVAAGVRHLIANHDPPDPYPPRQSAPG